MWTYRIARHRQRMIHRELPSFATSRHSLRDMALLPSSLRQLSCWILTAERHHLRTLILGDHARDGCPDAEDGRSQSREEVDAVPGVKYEPLLEATPHPLETRVVADRLASLGIVLLSRERGVLLAVVRDRQERREAVTMSVGALSNSGWESTNV